MSRINIAVFAVVGALALLASACGDDGSDVDAPVAPVTTQQELDPAPDPEGTPVEGEAVDEASSGEQDSEQEPPAVEQPAVEQPAVEQPAVEQPAVEQPAVEPVVEEEPAGPPHVAELAWGNFELAGRIAAKLDAGDPLNFVMSLNAIDSTGSASLEHGWSAAAVEVARQHDTEIDARVIGPNTADVEAQAATIESLIASADIDCLAVEAAHPLLLTGVIDAAVDAGIPVFSVGGDSPDSKRFAFYGLDDYAAGETAGQMVGQWAADGGILVRRAGVLTGDAGDQGSFDSMRGFVAGLSEIHSGVEWVNGPSDVSSFGFDPFAVHDATEAWVLENIDVDIVFHTDEGLEAVSRVIADQLLYGDMYAVGFHMSEPVTNYIRERVVVTAMAQGLAEQARRAGAACGDFLLGGTHDTGHVVIKPTAVTRDNVDEIDWTLPENQ